MLKNYSRILGLLFICFILIGFTITVNAEEEETTKDLGEIVVITATKNETKESDTPVVVEVITKEDLEEANVTTIEEALDSVNGINAIRNSSSTNWGMNGIELRGMGQDSTLILVDGQRFYGGMKGTHVDISTISPEMIEQIEIVKGPFSALYGSDAMGGVVNIITKKRAKGSYGNFSSSGGSDDTRNYSFGAGFGKERLGGTISYTYNESDGANKETDEHDTKIFNANFVYDFNDNSKLEISPYYSKRHNEYDGASSNKDDGRIQERKSLNLKWDYDLNSFSDFYVRGSLFRYNMWTENQHYVTASDLINDSREVEVGYNRLLGTQQMLTIGAYHQLQSLKDDNDYSTLDLDENKTTNSLFIQDEIDFEPFQIVVGTRLDHHEEWGSEVCPNIGLAYQANDKLKIRGSVGRAFRAPDMYDLYVDWPLYVDGVTYKSKPNPDLDPEESVGYQLGMDYNFSKKVFLNATIFRNEMENQIVQVYTPVGPTTMNVKAYNIGESVVQGAELSLNYQVTKNLRGSLGYTFLDTKDKGDIYNGKELTRRPNHNVSVGLNWKAPYGIKTRLTGLYKGTRYKDRANTEKLSSYWLLNLGFSKEFNDLYEAFFNIDNLLDLDEDDIDNKIDTSTVNDEYDIDGTKYYIGMKVKF